MKYGLTKQDFIYVNESIRQFSEISQVILIDSLV